MRRAQPVTLNTAQCKQLDRYARGRQVAVRLALRARIVLLAADGLENKQIAAQLGVSRQLVARWRTRFLESSIAGTQPGLPLKKGRGQTMTHDYKRNGTTTLFAALNSLDGSVIAECMPRHSHQEWLRFLRLIDRRTPKDKQLHLIVDNYATHKHAAVKRWLDRHPRFHIHFTPTSASWLNMAERFFRDLTVKRLRRGVFRSVDELVAAIDDYIAQHNGHPTPFIWTATASDILEKVKRGRAALHKVQSA